LCRVFLLIFFARLALFFPTFAHVYVLLVFEWDRGRLATGGGFKRGEVPYLSALYRLKFTTLPRSVFGIDG
jgi:hypothetical protein